MISWVSFSFDFPRVSLSLLIYYLAVVVVVTEIVIEIVMNDENENEVGLQENVETVIENRTGIEIEIGI